MPTVRQLRRAYDQLQTLNNTMDDPMDVDRLALLTQWARLDPRLAQILVEYLVKHWERLPLGQLIEALLSQPWPRAILVLMSFVELQIPLGKRARRVAIRVFMRALRASLPRPSQGAVELFFIPLQVPNPVVLRGEVEGRTRPYTSAGFLGAQSLLSRAMPPQNKTLLSLEQRQQVLADLLRRKGSIRVSDFIQACNGMVSRRQAQRDLKASKKLQAKGFTRGRVYKDG